ncbi:hypothetical protein ACFQ1E_04145 [Sphingomonas canadensis]|uniref:Secreted protein n=1 Tax=Sphingomonas canadensis TaxID=1219257 RepID=A0ABW3H5A3_9SPHN|nr:hypothetical protein [Sphingomonas canadensis]MCW3834565.1 hypothetical protein [Sphingomonas canadensis]
MKLLIKAAGAAGLLTLAACGGGADDRAAQNVEANAEAMSDALEAQADATNNSVLAEMLEDKADNVEDAGEARAREIDAKDDARLENKAR